MHARSSEMIADGEMLSSSSMCPATNSMKTCIMQSRYNRSCRWNTLDQSCFEVLSKGPLPAILPSMNRLPRAESSSSFHSSLHSNMDSLPLASHRSSSINTSLPLQNFLLPLRGGDAITYYLFRSRLRHVGSRESV